MTQVPQLTKPYCESCDQQTPLRKVIEEAYPGQYVTLFVSTCCNDMVRDETGRPIPYGMLSRIYEEQRSYEL